MTSEACQSVPGLNGRSPSEPAIFQARGNLPIRGNCWHIGLGAHRQFGVVERIGRGGGGLDLMSTFALAHRRRSDENSRHVYWGAALVVGSVRVLCMVACLAAVATVPGHVRAKPTSPRSNR
jgi:hypothetical protein